MAEKKQEIVQRQGLDNIIEGLHSLAIAIDDPVLDPANAMTHPEKNLSAIKGSLRVYRQRKPIVVNRLTGVVEAGNGTLTAAREMKWTHIAAVFVDDDPSTAAGFSISDNRTAQLSVWDDVALGKLMETIDIQDDGLQAMMDDLAAEHADILPSGEAFPELTPPETHTCIVSYRDDDIPGLLKFLGIETLPENRLGKAIHDRIKVITAAGTDKK